MPSYTCERKEGRKEANTSDLTAIHTLITPGEPMVKRVKSVNERFLRNVSALPVLHPLLLHRRAPRHHLPP
jgi:hypothetical protein